MASVPRGVQKRILEVELHNLPGHQATLGIVSVAEASVKGELCDERPLHHSVTGSPKQVGFCRRCGVV